MAAKQQIAATLRKMGLLPIAYRFYSLQREVLAARNLQQRAIAAGTHLFNYNRIRDCRKTLALAKVNLKQSRVTEGLKLLALQAYGPNQLEWIRRAALNELLIYGLATANSRITEVASNHLSGAWGWRSRKVRSVRELTMSLEHFSQPEFWSEPAGYKDFIRSSNTHDDQLIYGRANFGFGMPEDLFGPEVLRYMQTVWVNSLLEHHQLAGFEKDFAAKPLTIDDLPNLVREAKSYETGPKVTVLVPVFNGEEFLGTALAGLAAQTHRNLEVLVVDDCSTDGTRALVKKWAAKDSRFKLIEAKQNGGSYRARNIGLSEATGEFVTVHDADDWSHPQKIERQVAALAKNPKLLGSISHGIRVQHERLHFYPVAGRLFMRKNISSLMFRREIVQDGIGFWDEVRFGADSEFHERMEAKFGRSSVTVINGGPLSFTRVHAASLTGGGYASTQTGITGIRRFYTDAFKDWHAKIREGKTSGKLGRASEGRPFVAPILQHDRNGRYPKFDVVYLADLSGFQNTEYQLVLASIKGKTNVGLIHISSKTEVLHESVRNIIDFKNVTLLLPGDVATANQLRVLEPEVLATLPEKQPSLKADSIVFEREGVPHEEHLRAVATRVYGGKK